MANLKTAIVLWLIAGFFVMTGYGGAIGLPIGLIALWPFGVFLQRRVSTLVLWLTLVLSGVIFVGLSLAYLQWLVSSGFS